MAKVIGIGGVFLSFKGEDKALRDWYEEHLHLAMSDYGTGFIEGEQLMFVSFTHTNQPNIPYINFRVDDLKELMQELRDKKVIVLKPIEEYPYGLFAHIQDPFGNTIELWQANEKIYRKMVQDEIKKYKKNNHNS